MRFYLILTIIIFSSTIAFSQSEDQIAIEKVFNDYVKFTNENNPKATAELIYPKTFDDFLSKKQYIKASKKADKLYSTKYVKENTAIKKLPKVIVDGTKKYAVVEYNFEIKNYFKKFDETMVSYSNKVIKVYGFENVISDETNKRIKYRGTEKMYLIFDPIYNNWKTLGNAMVKKYFPKDILEDLNR